jgi:hypothetical protein
MTDLATIERLIADGMAAAPQIRQWAARHGLTINDVAGARNHLRGPLFELAKVRDHAEALREARTLAPGNAITEVPAGLDIFTRFLMVAADFWRDGYTWDDFNAAHDLLSMTLPIEEAAAKLNAVWDMI